MTAAKFTGGPTKGFLQRGSGLDSALFIFQIRGQKGCPSFLQRSQAVSLETSFAVAGRVDFSCLKKPQTKSSEFCFLLFERGNG